MPKQLPEIPIPLIYVAVVKLVKNLIDLLNYKDWKVCRVNVD